MKKIIMILIGLLFVGTGIFLLVSEHGKAKRCTIETIGIVVDIKKEVSTDRKYTYYPIISYQAEGQTITKQSNIGSSNIKYNVNDNIDVLYNPDNVEEFIINGDNSSNFVGIAFIIAGSLLVLLRIIKPVY